MVGKSVAELAAMREAGRIVAQVLAAVAEAARPGVTTATLDAQAEAIIRERGGVPSFKGYQGFPASICASINEEIVHGIPGERVLREGDLLSIDVGAIYAGYQGDAAVTVAVGQASEEALQLLAATREALEAAIAAARAGARLGDVSHAVEEVAGRRGFAVVREYGGHGIGRQMHEPPRVPNCGPAGHGPELVPGMTLALEPMLMLRDGKARVLADGWTVVAPRGCLSSHFEHTIAIRDGQAEILTVGPGGLRAGRMRR